MNTHRTDEDDDENTSFEVESPLEELKPGFVYGDEAGRTARRTSEDAEGHHRVPMADRKDIPQTSLAERIRAPRKGA
jgi:hypothetical protein